MTSIFQFTKNKKLETFSMILIILTFVIFALAYSLLTPTFEGPDEDAHYRYSIWLFNPELRPSLTHAIYNHVAQPLYYIVNSVFFNLLDPNDEKVAGLHVTYEYPINDKNRFQHGSEEIFPYSDIAATVHTMRLLSIVFGVITLIFVYKISKVIFPTNNWLPLYTMAFVSLIPMFLSINAVLNSDVLVWTLSTITLFFLLKFIDQPKRIRFIVFISIFTTLAISTKANALVLIPIFVVVISYLFISKQIKIPNLIKNILIYGLVSVASISWLWVGRVMRNIDYQNASVAEILRTAFGLTNGFSSIAPPGILNPSTATSFLFSRIFDIEFLLSRFINTSFGGFWWQSIWIPHIYYFVIYVFLLFSGIGLIILLIKKKNIRTQINIQKNHLMVLSTSIFLSLGFIYLNFLHTNIGIARYYFPIISMLGIAIPLGWYVFVYNKKKLQFLMFAPLIFLIFLNIQVLIVMEEEQNINLLQDDDFDGISNILDEDPNIFSNNFNDISLGKNNFGMINRTFIDVHDRSNLFEYIQSTSNIENHVLAYVKINSGLTKENLQSSINFKDSEIDATIKKLVDEKKIFTDGIAYYIVNPKFEIIPDLKQSAITIKFITTNLMSKPIEIKLCNDTDIFMNMGYEITFLCDKNGANIIDNNNFLKLPEGIEEGDLIQGKNKPEVYLIQDGQKHHIRTIEMFEKLGYTSNDIEFVTREILNKIPTGAPI
jgi:hypothetical protein